MLARAAAAAALALLIGGDIARLGWDAIGIGRFLFPYLGLFLFIEITRSRRRIEDGEVFLLGAAAALLYAGVYTKSLQQDLHPFGVDWPGAVEAVFNGGMTAVLALHVLGRARPRPSEESPDVFLVASLSVILIAAACVYAVKMSLNYFKTEALLGSTLFGDALFIGLTSALILRAKKQSEEQPSSRRDPWIFGLAAVVVWLPGARFVAHLCAAAGLQELLLYMFVGIWTAAVAGLFRRLWLERREANVPVSATGVAIWRACGAIAIVLIIGGAQTDGRADGMFAVLVDLPTRAIFAWIFFGSRLPIIQG